MQHAALLPHGEFNRRLEANVHPPDWSNPKPTGRYNLVVIGAGTAGLVTAAGAAGLGAKVALVERGLMGGDCLNVGCVPSKAIISAARAAANVKRAGEYGVKLTDPPVICFATVMERMRRLRAAISPNDAAERFRKLGVDVYFGSATFVDSSSVDVDGTKLEFARAVIATGTRAAAPSIPGLDSIGYLTNETLFSLTELPAKLGVIGAGPIGSEMAQSFARLGAEVHLIESENGVLPREDREAAKIVEQAMIADGVRLHCCGRDLSVSSGDSIRISIASEGKHVDQSVDQLLVAVGRTPNVEDLGLEKVGIEYDSKGVRVGDQLRTTNPRVYAAGDICSPYKFTHAADYMARVVIQNALFRGRARFSRLTIPWCTYTSPEVAHVGLSEPQAHEQGVEFDAFTQPLSEVDRAVLDSEDNGFVKILVKKGTDQIIGATIVAQHAGDLISEVTLAMTNKIGLGKIARTIHPYPTQADAIRKIGDQYNRTRLTPLVQSLFSTWLKWTR